MRADFHARPPTEHADRVLSGTWHLLVPSYYDHRALHSFPTRRSSDLPPNQPYGPSIPLHGRGRFAVVTDVGSGMRWTRAGGRSEAHTSELQSRSDLVCRLLLEKKKPCGTRYMLVAPTSFRISSSPGQS